MLIGEAYHAAGRVTNTLEPVESSNGYASASHARSVNASADCNAAFARSDQRMTLRAGQEDILLRTNGGA
jgi:hypothetical protein